MKLFYNYDSLSKQKSHKGWKEDPYFRYFKIVIFFLTALLMVHSILSKPERSERPGMQMVFEGNVQRDMQKYALKVPLYLDPKETSAIVKYYSDVNESFIFIERAKGHWIKVVDSDNDTGWVSSYLVKFKPGTR
ncbi:MAG TPA: SH3 domain-containing protein [Candidatus Hydrothermia bacterium]|nr:SH3 domain-containing protein [Candidatus Hydrothermia bacterium]